MNIFKKKKYNSFAKEYIFKMKILLNNNNNK